MAPPVSASTDDRAMHHGAGRRLRGGAGRSPLLASMDARVAAEPDPLGRACLRAERAGVLACHGALDEASAELAALRSAHACAPHAVVSAWLHWAEGLVLHFRHDHAAARDRLKRSLALATAVQARPVQALAAAWLAHADFTCHDFDSMVANVSIALRNAPADAHPARARASMVVAQSLHWAGRLELALPWYEKARTHAAAVQDEYMLGAHMHNMAWMRCAHERRLSIRGADDAAGIAQARAGAESSSRYDALVGTAFLAGLMPLLHAQLLLLQQNYVEALAVYETHAPAARRAGLERLECGLLADRAWCRLHTGDARGALDDARAALGCIGAHTQLDDRAMTRTLAARVLRACGEAGDAQAQSALAEADWQALAALHDRLVAALCAALPTA